jgi:hypothetical protein
MLREELASLQGEAEDLRLQLEMKDEAIGVLRAGEEVRRTLEASLAERDAEVASLRQQVAEGEARIAAAAAEADEAVKAALLDVRERVQSAVSAAIAQKDSELQALQDELRRELVEQAERAEEDLEVCVGGGDGGGAGGVGWGWRDIKGGTMGEEVLLLLITARGACSNRHMNAAPIPLAMPPPPPLICRLLCPMPLRRRRARSCSWRPSSCRWRLPWLLQRGWLQWQQIVRQLRWRLLQRRGRR